MSPIVFLLPDSDVAQVEDMLRRDSPFRGLPLMGFDIYSAVNVVRASQETGVRFTLILDRNVLRSGAPTRPPCQPPASPRVWRGVIK